MFLSILDGAYWEKEMQKEKKIISPEEFRKRMASLSDPIRFDAERSHRAADELMCQILTDYGYDKGVDIFMNMPKWYA